MQKLLMINAIVADIVTVLTIWGISDESPLWQNVLVTIIAVIVAIISVGASDAYDIKAINYYYTKKTGYRIYTKKNKYLVEGSVVSIYYKYREQEEEHDELVALGYVFADDNSSKIQIKVFNLINEGLMSNISASKNSYKKYHIKPNVEFSRISQIVMNESEENDAV